MSVITKIRDRAGLMVALIGLAIVSFLLMDVFSGNGLFSGQQSNNVGEIDGDEVSLMFFDRRMNEAIENYKINTNQERLDDATIGMLRDQVWTELVREKLMGTAYTKLGMAVSAEELFDMVQGTNINASVRQAFTNPQTGEFDRNQVVQFIRNLDQQPEDMQRRWVNFEKFIRSDRENQKYNTLISKGLYVPGFFAGRYYEHTNLQANGRFVLLDYALIADSSIQVSDGDLKAWYGQHKHEFESKEETRAVDYIVFDVRPSEDDDARALRIMNDLRVEFEATTNDSLFVALNSDLPFDDNFVAEAAIISDVQRGLFERNLQNSVSSVYREGEFYKITKMIVRTTRPDSVRARHILLQAAEGEPEEALRSRADSLMEVAKKGDFAAIAKANSADPGSAEKGGDLGFFAEGAMVKPFNDACFGGKKGDYVVVRSDFGMHIINITDQKGRMEVAKFATIANKIEPSTDTYRDVYAQAAKFLSKTKDAAAFETNLEEQGLVKRSAEVVRTGDRSLGGMNNSREMVRWAYRSKAGDVSSVFEMEDKYVVAALVKVAPKGTRPLEDVKTEVESKVRRERKAAQLIVRANEAIAQANNDLEAVARKAEGMVQQFYGATFQANFLSSIGREPVVNGVLFGLKAGSMSAPLKGERGVYVLVVDDFTALPENPDLEPGRQAVKNQLAARVANEVFNAKKEKANIEDNRHLFY
jgi:peptidyl-prolyl cis-trans isomerase D